jgi:hypothetical protein
VQSGAVSSAEVGNGRPAPRAIIHHRHPKTRQRTEESGETDDVITNRNDNVDVIEMGIRGEAGVQKAL